MFDNSFRLDANSGGYYRSLHTDFCGNNQICFSLGARTHALMIQSEYSQELNVRAELVKSSLQTHNVFPMIHFNIMPSRLCVYKKWKIYNRMPTLIYVCMCDISRDLCANIGSIKNTSLPSYQL